MVIRGKFRIYSFVLRKLSAFLASNYINYIKCPERLTASGPFFLKSPETHWKSHPSIDLAHVIGAE